MASLGNPLSITGGAAGDLGLSSAAQNDALNIANTMKKKKLQEEKAMKAGVQGATQSAFQALTGYGTM